MDKKDLKDEKLLYNVRETAAVLGVNVHLVYELINRKLLPALRLGSRQSQRQDNIVENNIFQKIILVSIIIFR